MTQTQMINAIKEQTRSTLDNAISGVFSWAHQDQQTTTGDISPDQVFLLDVLKDDLLTLIAKQVAQNLVANEEEENNLLIAQFMGETQTHQRYINSWDAMKFVLRKIEDLGYNVDVFEDNTNISDNENPRRMMISQWQNTKMINTRKAIIEFIKYYNKKSNHNTKN
tara:strand:+ start:624 stop:1121 length:498 start_codon:yes stop_codon:yes gene_type:complete